jgi:hypothetical protein
MAAVLASEKPGFRNISIENVRFLSPDECESLRKKLFDLRQYWESRTPVLPFYTLGAASYLDADRREVHARDEAYYVERAGHFNPILREHFGWLYNRLSPFLAKRLGAPVGYRESGGLPGFNLMLAHRAYIKMTPSIHYDWQYQNLDWSWASNYPKLSTISFTLAIALPQEGSGLNVWDVSEEQIFGPSSREVHEYVHTVPPTLFPYRVGDIALHFGQVFHQVPSPKVVCKGDERITLQGHGCLCDGSWHLFW